MTRSILPVLSGVVTICVLVVCGDQLMPRLFRGAFDAQGFPTNAGALAVMLAYTVVFAAIGGWVTASLSRPPIRWMCASWPWCSSC
jgi:hypothetical protein